MTTRKLKLTLLDSAQTPAGKSIGAEMPAAGKLTTWKDRDGNCWVQVDSINKKKKRFKCALPSYNPDAKIIIRGAGG